MTNAHLILFMGMENNLIRDEEIKRLISYIKGLGLKVSFSSLCNTSSAADWAIDNSQITVYKVQNTTKISTILSLIHEMGHALHNIHEKDRKIDKKIEKALDHLNSAEELEMDTQKKQRKIILNDEIAGTYYWDSIYKETNMKFPMWRLESSKEFDTWQYQVFYETGEYPTYKERKIKEKEVRTKHRNQYE